MTTHTVPTASVETWKMADAYIRDIVNGEGSIAWGASGDCSDTYTAIRARISGSFGYNLHRNTGNGELGPVVHRVNVHPTRGMVYA